MDRALQGQRIDTQGRVLEQDSNEGVGKLPLIGERLSIVLFLRIGSPRRVMPGSTEEVRVNLNAIADVPPLGFVHERNCPLWEQRGNPHPPVGHNEKSVGRSAKPLDALDSESAGLVPDHAVSKLVDLDPVRAIQRYEAVVGPVDVHGDRMEIQRSFLQGKEHLSRHHWLTRRGELQPVVVRVVAHEANFAPRRPRRCQAKAESVYVEALAPDRYQMLP
eukprot:scaffold213_cov245-Pinguiococcus_pyrenoidosus.AAC.18